MNTLTGMYIYVGGLGLMILALLAVAILDYVAQHATGPAAKPVPPGWPSEDDLALAEADTTPIPLFGGPAADLFGDSGAEAILAVTEIPTLDWALPAAENDAERPDRAAAVPTVADEAPAAEAAAEPPEEPADAVPPWSAFDLAGCPHWSEWPTHGDPADQPAGDYQSLADLTRCTSSAITMANTVLEPAREKAIA